MRFDIPKLFLWAAVVYTNYKMVIFYNNSVNSQIIVWTLYRYSSIGNSLGTFSIHSLKSLPFCHIENSLLPIFPLQPSLLSHLLSIYARSKAIPSPFFSWLIYTLLPSCLEYGSAVAVDIQCHTLMKDLPQVNGAKVLVMEYITFRHVDKAIHCSDGYRFSIRVFWL